MAVYVNEKQRTFTLQTKNTTYQMKVDAYGMLLHTYYGEKTVGTNRYYIAKAQNDQVDMLIEVQRNRDISAATDRAEIDGVYYRIVQVQQVTDENGTPMTDLALERVEGIE